MKCNVFGDIAGNYKTLMELIKKMPDVEPISVGDMVDRGPRSKQVLDFFMSTGRALFGNHEHLMVDCYREGGYYEDGLWVIHNGGMKTLESFGDTCVLPRQRGLHDFGENTTSVIYDADKIPLRYIEWLESLPLYIDEDGLFISHASKNPTRTIEMCCYIGEIGFNRNLKFGVGGTKEFCKMDQNFIWNRGGTRRMKDKFQVHGHMQHMGVEWYGDKNGRYGINIDTSAAKILTGFNWPSMTIYQQEYID